MLKKWNRIGASVIDLSISIMFFQITYKILLIPFGFFLALRGGGAPSELIFDIMRVFFRLGWFVFIAVGYNYLFHLKFNNSLGRMLLRVHLIDEKSTDKKLITIEKKQLLKREIYKWTLSIGTLWLYCFYVGILIILKQNYRGYHNKISHTKVEVWL
ncbi:MAG: RDD family protein [Mycoplasmatales bacterium]